MLEPKIKALKTAIENQSSLTAKQKSDLLELSDQLASELETVGEPAASILSQTHQAVETPHEAHHDLQDSLREFEVSHPNLVRIVQSICAQFGV